VRPEEYLHISEGIARGSVRYGSIDGKLEEAKVNALS
jgi:hypothetical protein